MDKKSDNSGVVENTSSIYNSVAKGLEQSLVPAITVGGAILGNISQCWLEYIILTLIIIIIIILINKIFNNKKSHKKQINKICYYNDDIWDRL